MWFLESYSVQPKHSYGLSSFRKTKVHIMSVHRSFLVQLHSHHNAQQSVFPTEKSTTFLLIICGLSVNDTAFHPAAVLAEDGGGNAVLRHTWAVFILLVWAGNKCLKCFQYSLQWSKYQSRTEAPWTPTTEPLLTVGKKRDLSYLYTVTSSR